MTQTFDTYSKHSTAYKLAGISGLIFMLILLSILILPNSLTYNLSNFANKILISAFVLSLICLIAGLFLRTIRSNILMYIKDGELEIDFDKLLIKTKTYHLDDLNKIEFKIIGYRGQAGSRSGKDGTGNKIKIYEKSNQILEKLFVLNTKEQLDNLKSILMHWKQVGAKVKVDGLDVWP